MWWLNGGGRLASSLWPCSSPNKSSLPFQKLRTCMVLTRPVEWQKEKKKKKNAYKIVSILSSFYFNGKLRKRFDFATEKLTSNLCGLNLLGSLYTMGSRCIDLASMFMFHPFLILNPTMINTLHEINSCKVYCTKFLLRNIRR